MGFTSSCHPVTSSSPHRLKPVVGLVGGMGSGKSLLAAEFARRGARVVSGDALGHEALEQPAIRQQVVQHWGQEVVGENGHIDRSKLGAIVFSAPAERRVLEDLLFPWIERRFREEIQAAQLDPAVPLIVFDAAVMLEAGWDYACDWLVYVHAPRDLRLRRLAAQRGWSSKEVTARESAQMPLTQKSGRADYTVDNSGSPEELARQVDDLLRSWEIAC